MLSNFLGYTSPGAGRSNQGPEFHGEEEAASGCVCKCVCVCVCLFRVEADSVISFLLCLNVSMFEHDPHWPRARYKRCGPVHLPPARTKVGWWCGADSSKENV